RRESHILEIGECTTEVQRMLIARELGLCPLGPRPETGSHTESPTVSDPKCARRGGPAPPYDRAGPPRRTSCPWCERAGPPRRGTCDRARAPDDRGGAGECPTEAESGRGWIDRQSTRLNCSHVSMSY